MNKNKGDDMKKQDKVTEWRRSVVERWELSSLRVWTMQQYYKRTNMNDLYYDMIES